MSSETSSVLDIAPQARPQIELELHAYERHLVSGCKTIPVKNPNLPLKSDKLGNVSSMMHRHVHNNLNIGFKYLPYSFIGDAITLTLANGKKVAASYHTLRLRKDLRLTYGQINSLARDFYGTYEPISDGATEEARGERFIAAFNTLANGEPHRLSEAMDILDVFTAGTDQYPQ